MLGLPPHRGAMHRGIVGKMWQRSKSLLLWGLSSPLMLLALPLIVIGLMLMFFLVLVVLLAAAPVLYAFFIRRRIRRRKGGDGDIIEAEYWVDGEKKR